MFTPSKIIAEQIVKEYETPLFVTDAHRLRENVQKLVTAFEPHNVKIFYALKANYDPHIVKIIKNAGIYGIDAVSPYEVRMSLELGYTPQQIIYTPSNPSDDEMRFVYSKNVLQNLGSLSELTRFGELFPGSDVSLRICPEVGAGESDKVTTGHIESKFGVTREDMSYVHRICKKYDLTLIGIHSHIGSGFYTPDVFERSVEAVCAIAKEFSHLVFVDLGGGFGVRYKTSAQEINLCAFANVLDAPIKKLEKELGKKIEIRIEPGKFIVTDATVLLTRVTTIKSKNAIKFVGVDSGFYNLIRPAMYGAYHHIINLTHSDDPLEHVSVVGNVCETCDVFNGDAMLAAPHEGDLLAILCAGGYGASMSSNYNLRPLAAHVLIDNEQITLTRKQQTYDQIMENFTPLKNSQ